MGVGEFLKAEGFQQKDTGSLGRATKRSYFSKGAVRRSRCPPAGTS